MKNNKESGSELKRMIERRSEIITAIANLYINANCQTDEKESARIRRDCRELANCIGEYYKLDNVRYGLSTSLWHVLRDMELEAAEGITQAYMYGFIKGMRYQKKTDSK